MTPYFRFVNSKHVLEDELRHGHEIDKRGLQLLEVIALKYAENEPLMITEVMCFSKLGSPAAIHRSLRRLVDAGLIKVFFKGKNRRTKYLSVSDKATQHFGLLGEALIEFAR